MNQQCCSKKLLADAAASGIDIQGLLVQLLTDYKDQVTQWVDKGEGVVFDTLVGTLSGSNALLAALLEARKADILQLGDKFTTEVIDEIIAVLSGK